MILQIVIAATAVCNYCGVLTFKLSRVFLGVLFTLALLILPSGHLKAIKLFTYVLYSPISFRSSEPQQGH